MIVWVGSKAPGGLIRALDEAAHPYWLTSFFEHRGKQHMTDPSEFVFFLDSGAFSAWSRGTAIDIDEYIAFVKANIDHIEVYANLDVIPGQPGRNATKAEREIAAAQSWENFLYMRGEGLNPIPIFHVGEDWSWLDKMVAATDYIGLGGMVGSHLTPDLRRSWLDSVFLRICDAEGKPLVKVHGFGMTAIPLVFRYPWYSVDSTTWIQVAANGGVYLPAIVGDQFVFDRIPQVVAVSAHNPKQKQGGKGSNTMTAAMRAILDRWLLECGKSYDEVHSHYYHRAVVNVAFFKRVSEAKLNQRFQVERPRKQSLVA